MAMWRSGHRTIYELNAWQKADAFAMLLHDVCSELQVGRDKEWLLYLLIKPATSCERHWKRAGITPILPNVC